MYFAEEMRSKGISSNRTQVVYSLMLFKKVEKEVASLEAKKSLAWSSITLALKNIKEEVVERPKALGDIRGVTYIYGMFYRFGLIDVPDEVKEKMGHPKDRKK
mgnify:CR=1 FL=1